MAEPGNLTRRPAPAPPPDPTRPSRDDLLNVLGEVFCAIPAFDWRVITKHLSPPMREAFADAVDEYFADDPHAEDGDEPVTADRWWRNDAPIPSRVQSTMIYCMCGWRGAAYPGQRVEVRRANSACIDHRIYGALSVQSTT